MLRKISFILAVCALVSCNPFIDKALRKKNRCNNKLEKLVLKCPNLLQTQIIIDTVEVLVPEIHIDTVILTNQDVSGVDSIVDSFMGEIDSLTALKLSTQIKWYIKERPCLIDTLAFEKYGVQVKVFQDGDKIRVSFYKPEEIIEKEIEIEVQKVAIQPLTLLERARIFVGRSWPWMLLIAFFVLVAFLIKPRLFKFFGR